MNNILQQIYNTSVENNQQLSSINNSLAQLLANETAEFKSDEKFRKEEKKIRKREAQMAKRKAGDKKGLFETMPKKKQEKEKKSIGQVLLEALGAVGSSIMSILGGLGSMVGGMLASALGGLGIGAMITSALAAVGPALIIAVKAAAIAAGTVALAKTGSTFKGSVYRQSGGVQKTKKGVGFDLQDINQLKEKHLKFQNETSGKLQGEGLKQFQRYEDLEEAMRSAKSANDRIYNNEQEISRLRTEGRPGYQNQVKKLQKQIAKDQKQKADQTKLATKLYADLKISEKDLIQHQIDNGRRNIDNLPQGYKKEDFKDRPMGTGLTSQFEFNTYNDEVAPVQRQQGGRIPTLLEPGEKVFSPGEWNAGVEALNNIIPRFQKGGKTEDPTAETGDGRDTGGDTKSGPTNHAYLTKLNDENIRKVSAPPGMCVTGSLDTMQASGVPNPPNTGQDVGNNPRGGAAQLIKNFGWGGAYGAPITLNSPYGNVPSKVLTKEQYLKLVESGGIPSGAMIFQTRHDSWNGTSGGSRGYDMAIAQQNGKALWNGQSLGSLVYGNTKKVMVLTPGGEASQADPGGANGFMQALGQSAEGVLKNLGGVGGFIAGVGEGLGELFGTDGMSLLQGGWQSLVGMGAGVGGFATGGLGAIMSMFGAGGDATGPGGGGDPNAPAAQLSGDTQSKAKMMYDYIKSKGYTSAQAKGIVANIHRESTFNPTARSGDDQGPGGLFQWKGGRQTSTVAGLVNSGNWKGQIDYALQEDVGPQYKGATANMNAFDASMWWAEKWERPASLQNARNKHSSFLGGYGFQQGGVVGRSASYGNKAAQVKEAQEEFAQMIASAVDSDPIVVYEDAPQPSTTIAIGAPHQMAPTLPTGPSSIQAAEYFYNLSLGGTLA